MTIARTANKSRLVRPLSVLACACALFATALATANVEDDDQDVNYDVIVNNLSRQVNSMDASATTTRARAPRPVVSDPLDSVWMHAGIGFANALQTLALESGAKSSLNLKGFQAHLGIDLFSENWLAEGTVRSFSDSDDSTSHASLKEFELKIFYKDRLTRGLGFRAGLGVSGRYLSLRTAANETLSYTTPSSVATFGLDFYLTERFSFGVDVSGRTAMVSETADRNSFDGAVRVDAHF